MTTKTGIACESAGVLELTESATPGLFKDVTIIREGWGQSGYYPGDVLHRDGPQIFVEGTRIFLNHASGPVEDAAAVMGVLAGPAVAAFDDAGKAVLKAPMQIFTTGIHNNEWVKERAKAKAIEVSIRSGVKYAQGTREGRRGPVVSAMTEAFSVDVVARGGAGGKFGVIEESAQIGVTSEEEEGSDMALTAEESTALATAFAEALKPQFAEITTALGDLKIATESKKVEGDAPKALSAREINEKITGVDGLSEASTARIYTAIESAEVATSEVVEAAIAAEESLAEEAMAALKAKLGDGHAVFTEAAGKATDTETKAYTPGTVGAWGKKVSE